MLHANVGGSELSSCGWPVVLFSTTGNQSENTKYDNKEFAGPSRHSFFLVISHRHHLTAPIRDRSIPNSYLGARVRYSMFSIAREPRQILVRSNNREA